MPAFPEPTLEDMLDLKSQYCTVAVKNQQLREIAPKAGMLNDLIHALLLYEPQPDDAEVNPKKVMPIWTCGASLAIAQAYEVNVTHPAIPVMVLKQAHRQLIAVGSAARAASLQRCASDVAAPHAFSCAMCVCV